jgi:hypothetical protein
MLFIDPRTKDFGMRKLTQESWDKLSKENSILSTLGGNQLGSITILTEAGLYFMPNSCPLKCNKMVIYPK